jgi:hypothetical protein
VRVHEFQFSIELSGAGASAEMLRDLALLILTQAGCEAARMDEAVQALQAAVASKMSPRGGIVHVRFRASAGELEIEVNAADGRPAWRTIQIMV